MACSAIASTAFAGPTDPRCAAQVGFYQPEAGMVGDASLARKIAELYLVSIYGVDTIKDELPLRVLLRRGVWHVAGSWTNVPGQKGGVAEIDICRSNGKVLRVVHGK
jgi:hypothetical protein